MDAKRLIVSILMPVEAQPWQELDECFDEDVATDLVTEYGDRLPAGAAIRVKRDSGEVTWLGVATPRGAVRAPDVPRVPNDDEGAIGWLGRWDGATPEVMVQTLEVVDPVLTARACWSVARRCLKPGRDKAAEALLLKVEARIESVHRGEWVNLLGPRAEAELRMEELAPESREYLATWAAVAAADVLLAQGPNAVGFGTVCVRAATRALRAARVKKPWPVLAAAVREVVPIGLAMLAALDE